MSLDQKYNRTMALFTTFSAMYGNLWNSQYAAEELLKPALKIWDAQLKILTNEEIEWGVTKCIDSLNMPPTLPQFLEMCKINATDLKIPSSEECFVTKNDTYYTLIGKLPSWDVQHFTNIELRRAFKEIYAQYLREELQSINKPQHKLAFIRNKLKVRKMLQKGSNCHQKNVDKKGSDDMIYQLSSE